MKTIIQKIKYVFTLYVLLVSTSLNAQFNNVIPNFDFSSGASHSVPDEWTVVSARPDLSPLFYKEKKEGKSYLLMKGTGNPAAVGYIKTTAPILPGRTYEFKVLFSKSKDINPQRHLLFQCIGSNNHDGIMDFYKLNDELIEGRSKIFFPESGSESAEIRLYYKIHPKGEVKIYNVSLTETEPNTPHWIRVACTSGIINTEQIIEVIEQAANENVDLLLLPEHLNRDKGPEVLSGETCKILSEQALKHKMFIAAAIIRQDEMTNNKFNTGVIYDRSGKLLGTYDKIHPYSPELNDKGFTPGNSVRIFDTELGKISFIICYDSWFTDVTQLAALKGAKIILFPNAGYYKSLLHARAADNRVRIIASSLYDQASIFDTAGRDIQNPEKDPSVGVSAKTYDNIKEYKIGKIKMLVASLDMNCSPSPHYNGGTMMEAPGGKRNRDEQIYYLDEDIKIEKERWWNNN